MANYRIHIDPPPPDPALAEKHRDFEALYRNYQTQRRFDFWRNLYRKPRNFAVLMMLVAVGFLVFRADVEAPRRTYVLHPPKGEAAPALQAQAVDPAAALGLDVGEGVKVEVPALAWTDSSGAPVRGEVQLHYRLIQGPAEAFAAGVPRPWDSTRALTELRLVEVYATQAGQRLHLRSGHRLTVNWTLAQRHPRLQVQALDSSVGRWQSLKGWQWRPAEKTAEAAPSPPEPPVQVLDQVADTLIAKAARRPAKPARPFGNRPRNLADFPQLRGYEKVYWAYVDRPGSSNPWSEGLIDAERPWNDVRIRSLGEGLYELRFARVSPEGGMETRRVIARPLLEASNDAEAMAWYRREVARYRVERAAMEASDSMLRVQAETQRRYETELEAWQKAQNTRDLDPKSPGGSLSYRLEQAGVSGLWVAVAVPENTQTYPTEEDGISLQRAWQPWYYAVEGDTLWPVWVEDQELKAAAPKQASLQWWLARPSGVVHRKME